MAEHLQDIKENIEGFCVSVLSIKKQEQAISMQVHNQMI